MRELKAWALRSSAEGLAMVVLGKHVSLFLLVVEWLHSSH